ncbi:unnamed protein product [Paramecium sonneborni]|uniref:Protein kinase domain-containing protein n=1 Tax=Paramecium sonneborni TaxID=65129 RepID=A0A8S1MR09_9CILI|nr:unnamed protein product [Paramecium sonneborni]
MGVQQSNTNECVSFLSNMKMIQEKGNCRVYENQKNQKFDYKEFKSSETSFKDELEVGKEIQNQNYSGIAKIEQIEVQTLEKWYTNYFTLCLLTEHPTYSLKEYCQRKEKYLTYQQITELLVSISGAQHILGMKKQYLSFDNIFTNDGNIWKLKPFFESESSYEKLMKFKAQKIVDFELNSFPAPEEFEGKVCDPDRVQVFGLGIIILELITKQKSSNLYQEYKLNETLLSQRIQAILNVKNQFSGNVIDIIIDMIDTDLVRRPNFQQLVKKLKSPSSKIVCIQTKMGDIQEISKLHQSNSINLFGSKNFSQIEQQKLSQALEQAQVQISDSIKKMKKQQESIRYSQIRHEQNGNEYQGEIVNNLYQGNGRLKSKSGDLIYEGEFLKGQYHNFGVQYFYNTNKLQKSYDFQNCQDIMKYAKQYEGYFQLGMKHGDGKLILNNGEYYIGEFRNDQLNGCGQFDQLTKNRVIGFWNNGILRSTPTFQKEFTSIQSPHFSNESKIPDEIQKQPQTQINSDLMPHHQGDFGVETSQIQFNGISKLQSCKSLLEASINNHQQYFNFKQSQNKKDYKLYYDETKTMLKYEGQLFTGQMHGRGTLYFKDGRVHYEGDFVAGNYEGFGILFNEKPEIEMNINYNDLRDVNIKGWWKKYEGTFQNGQKEGHGYWYLTDDSVVLGLFQNDQVHGEGYLKRPKIQDVYAEWQNGILQQVRQGKL